MIIRSLNNFASGNVVGASSTPVPVSPVTIAEADLESQGYRMSTGTWRIAADHGWRPRQWELAFAIRYNATSAFIPGGCWERAEIGGVPIPDSFFSGDVGSPRYSQPIEAYAVTDWTAVGRVGELFSAAHDFGGATFIGGYGEDFKFYFTAQADMSFGLFEKESGGEYWAKAGGVWSVRVYSEGTPPTYQVRDAGPDGECGGDDDVIIDVAEEPLDVTDGGRTGLECYELGADDPYAVSLGDVVTVGRWTFQGVCLARWRSEQAWPPV